MLDGAQGFKFNKNFSIEIVAETIELSAVSVKEIIN